MREDAVGTGNWTSLVVGAVVGAAVGAGVALLLAPRSGRETRELLARNTRGIKDRAATAFDQVKETVQRETKGIVGQAVKDITSVQPTIR